MADRVNALRYDVDERPPLPLAIGLGLQSALFVVGGNVFLPLLLEQQGVISSGQASYLIAVAMLIGGLTTAVQVVRVGYVGSGYVLFMGTSGVFFVATQDALALGGIGFVAALTMIAAPAEWLFAWALRWLRNLLTPAVGGVVVMLVAVTVAPLSIGAWQGTGTENAESVENFVIGGATFVVMVGILMLAPPKLRLWSPLLGLAAGVLTALAFGAWELEQTRDAAIVGFPIGEWTAPTFLNTAEGWVMVGAFIIATLSGTLETVGDAIAVQKVSRRSFRKIDYDSLRGALNADGVGNFLAGLLGSTPNTTYSAPIGMIPMVGVASRAVGMFGALSLALMAFTPIFIGFILDLPGPAVGAATFVTFCVLFVTGMRVVIEDGISSQNGLIVGLAFWGGFAAEQQLFFPQLLPDWVDPVLGNAISTGAVIAVVLSLLLSILPRRRFQLRVAAQPDRLSDVMAFAEGVGQSLKLGPNAAFRLQVCLEELFTHLTTSGRATQTSRRLSIQATLDEDDIEIAVTDRADVRDVDMPYVPSELGEAGAEELRDLGLILISRLATNISHTTISGWNYINFRVDRREHGAGAAPIYASPDELEPSSEPEPSPESESERD